MLGVLDLPTYLVGVIVVVLLPGPNSLFVLATASRRGHRAAYAAACGVFAGDAILMLLAAGGVASALQTHPELFSVVKYLGAAYLTWLGLTLLVAAVKKLRGGTAAAESAEMEQAVEAESDASSVVDRAGASGAFRRALVISLLNPKAILFFVSFFVQFVDPAYPHPWLSFLVLGGVLQVASFVYLSVLIVSGVRLAASFGRRRSLTALLGGGAGVVFIVFAVKLGTATV